MRETEDFFPVKSSLIGPDDRIRIVMNQIDFSRENLLRAVIILVDDRPGGYQLDGKVGVVVVLKIARPVAFHLEAASQKKTPGGHCGSRPGVKLHFHALIVTRTVQISVLVLQQIRHVESF